MPSVNQLNTNIDLTVRVYDNFYNFGIDVPSNEYDVVNSYFKSVFESQEAADNFTVTLFRIAEETNTNVLTLLNQLSDQDQIQLTATLGYYLNGLRSPSTLLGINTTVTPNVWAARNVIL
jgi:aconitase B